MLANGLFPLPSGRIACHRPYYGFYGCDFLRWKTDRGRSDQIRKVITVTGKHTGEVGYIGIGICFDGLAGGAGFFGAVIIQLIQTNGEKLHNFTRIIFVRYAAGSGIFFPVVKRAQVNTHGGVEGHIFE